jgi:hypothetical protein
MPSKISDRARVSRFAFIAGLTALLLSAQLVTAAAQPAGSAAAREGAKQKLREGAQQLRDGEYADALKTFQHAYELVPSPKIFFNFGLAYQGLARYADALEHFQRFVAEAKDANRETQSQALFLIRDLRAKVAFVNVTCDRPGADIVVDGRARGKTPQAQPFAVDPGPHQLVVELDGKTRTRPFSAQAGVQSEISIVLQEARSTEPPPPLAVRSPPREAPVGGLGARPEPVAATPIYQRPWLWAAVGAVVAGGIVTAVLLGRRTEYPQATLGKRAVPE